MSGITNPDDFKSCVPEESIEPEVLPCNCGEIAVIDMTEIDDNIVIIKCMQCGEMVCARTKQEAVNQWNVRQIKSAIGL